MAYEKLGLNNEVSGFSQFVMTQQEHIDFVGEDSYIAVAAYPKPVSAGLGGRPRMNFFREDATTRVEASNVNVRFPQINSLTKLIAWLLLPKTYKITDSCAFDAPNGQGTVTITSTSIESNDVLGNFFARLLLMTKNRPGAFLKIRKTDTDEFYTDMFVFCPGQDSTLSHRPVKHGEIFILLKDGIEFDAERIHAANVFYDTFVKKSYGDNDGLYDLADGHQINTPQ